MVQGVGCRGIWNDCLRGREKWAGEAQGGQQRWVGKGRALWADVDGARVDQWGVRKTVFMTAKRMRAELRGSAVWAVSELRAERTWRNELWWRRARSEGRMCGDAVDAGRGCGCTATWTLRGLRGACSLWGLSNRWGQGLDRGRGHYSARLPGY